MGDSVQAMMHLITVLVHALLWFGTSYVKAAFPPLVLNDPSSKESWMKT